MWHDYVEAFTLGNAAIIGNVCVLPLYPGMLVLWAHDAERGRPARWLGAVVFAGSFVALVAIGLVLQQLGRSTADVLGWLLPLMYGAVVVLGFAMLLGRSPFARLGVGNVPTPRNRVAAAFSYGMALAPLTLPCTGPLLVSAFVVGSVAGTGQLVDSLAYAAAFAVGFGWPMIVLPLLAAPVQRQVTRGLARHHRAVEVVSGLLLVAIAALGFWTDVRPRWWPADRAAASAPAAALGEISTGPLRWARRLEGPVVPGPIVAPDGSVYAASNGGVLHRLDPATGTDRWRFDGGGTYGDDLSTSATLLPDGTVLWPGPRSILFALDPDGHERWRVTLTGLVLTPAVVGGRAYVADRAGHLSAVDLEGPPGRVAWSVELGGATYARPTIGADGAIYTSGGHDLVRLSDLGDRARIDWRHATGDLIEASPAVTPDGHVVTASNDGKVYALDARGRVAWTFDVGDFVYSSLLATRDGRVLFGDNNGIVFVLDATSGRAQRRTQLPPRNGSPDGVWTAPIVDSTGSVFVGTVSGHVYRIDPSGALGFDIATGATVASYPALGADGTVFIGSSDGQLYAIG